MICGTLVCARSEIEDSERDVGQQRGEGGTEERTESRLRGAIEAPVRRLANKQTVQTVCLRASHIDTCGLDRWLARIVGKFDVCVTGIVSVTR